MAFVHTVAKLRGLPLPLWCAVGLAVAAPALTWWAIGPLGQQWPDHEYGPYHVPLGLERAAGVAAILTVLACVFGIARSLRDRRANRHEVLPGTAAALVAVGVLGAITWRVETAGFVGADIGGLLFLLVGAIGIAALLCAAVGVEHRARGNRMRYARLFGWLAVLAAPVLLAALFGLSWYEQSIGVISSADYTATQPSGTHSAIRHRLGRPGELADWFFAPAPAGTACECYSGAGTAPTQYQFCYRGGVLVSKQASDHPR